MGKQLFLLDLLKRLFFLHFFPLMSFLGKKNPCVDLFLRLCSDLLIYVPALILASHCLDSYIFMININSSLLSFPPTLFYFKIDLDYSGSLLFHINFRISLSISTNKPARVWTNFALNVYTLLITVIFTTLSLMFEHDRSLYIALSST